MKKRLFLSLLLSAALAGGAVAQTFKTPQDVIDAIKNNPYRAGDYFLDAIKLGIPLTPILQGLKEQDGTLLARMIQVVKLNRSLLPPEVDLGDVIDAAIKAGFEPTEIAKAAIEAGLSLPELKDALKRAGVPEDVAKKVEDTYKEASPA